MLIRAVVTHLDGTVETTEWHPEGSAEAVDAMFAIVRKQTKDGFSVELESREEVRIPPLPAVETERPCAKR